MGLSVGIYRPFFSALSSVTETSTEECNVVGVGHCIIHAMGLSVGNMKAYPKFSMQQMNPDPCTVPIAEQHVQYAQHSTLTFLSFSSDKGSCW